MKRLSITILFLVTLFAASSQAQESPLIGKPCPTLMLKEYMLQGEPISQLDFDGKVVFVEIFQRG